MTNFGKGKREGESPETLKGDIRWWTFGFDEDSVKFCNFWMIHHISVLLLFLIQIHPEGESPETLKGDGHSTRWANTEY